MRRPQFATKVAAAFNGLCFILLVLTFIAAVVDFPHTRPVWWAFTQATAWNLVVHLVYFSYSFVVGVDNKSRFFIPNLILHRDRMFAVCLALAGGAVVFYSVVLLPFTPKLLKLGGDCHGSSSDCTSVDAFVTLLVTNFLPLLLLIIDLLKIDHRLSFRSLYVEVAVILFYALAYFTFAVICWLFSGFWPYAVDEDSVLAGNSVWSFFLHCSMAIFFILSYLGFRALHARLWKAQPDVHYTDSLLSSIEEAWRESESHANEFEINVFNNNGNAQEPSNGIEPNPSADHTDVEESYSLQ